MLQEDREQWKLGHVAGKKHGLSISAGPRTKRRRARNWWGSDDVVDSSTSDDDRYEPPRSRARTESPPVVDGQFKRRHVDPGIGGPLSTMTLNETQGKSYVAEINDDDMPSGNSYEISPDRIYVHSLDDSDEEEQPEYVINQHVAEKLRSPSAFPSPPIPRPSESQALIRWQPYVVPLPDDHDEEHDDGGAGMELE